MNAVVRFASAFTRAWVRLYTARMPDDLRTERSTEIESDLWEHQRDAIARGLGPVGISIQILARTAHGMTDDVTWRFEALRERRRTSQERRIDMARPVTSWMGLGGVVGGILWAASVPLMVASATYGRRSFASWYLLATILFVVGLAGAHAQWRGRAGRIARVGCVVLGIAGIASIAMTLGAQFFGVDLTRLRVNIYGLLFEVPSSVAFLLIAIGAKGLGRIVSIAAGCVGLVLATMPEALPIVQVGDLYAYAPLPLLFRLLVGIGLVLIGYDAFRQSNAPNEPRSSEPLAAGAR